MLGGFSECHSHRYRETPTWLGGVVRGLGWFGFVLGGGWLGWFRLGGLVGLFGFFCFCFLFVGSFVLRFSLTKPCGSGRSVVRRKGFFWQVAITIKLWSENQTVPSSGGAGCFWKETQRRGAQQIFKTFTT